MIFFSALCFMREEGVRQKICITWTWTGTVGEVKILYTLDGGSFCTTIVIYTPNDGSHQWMRTLFKN